MKGSKMRITTRLLLAGALFSGAIATPAAAQSFLCEDSFKVDDTTMSSYRFGPPLPPPVNPADSDPLQVRLLKYAAVAVKHRLNGLASYYSTSLDGTLTANGERYHNKQMSAAHLTLPLGSWVEITAKATGRRLRLRVNDRGPYVNKFVIDLSQAAARYLGVDVTEDRTVLIRIIALPGEDPLPDGVFDGPRSTAVEETATLDPAGQ